MVISTTWSGSHRYLCLCICSLLMTMYNMYTDFRGSMDDNDDDAKCTHRHTDTGIRLQMFFHINIIISSYHGIEFYLIIYNICSCAYVNLHMGESTVDTR